MWQKPLRASEQLEIATLKEETTTGFNSGALIPSSLVNCKGVT
jgi:hypothetical protein